MLGCLLSDRVIVQLVPFLVGCLIIRLVCFMYSGLCALLCDHLTAYLVGGFLVISCFLLSWYEMEFTKFICGALQHFFGLFCIPTCLCMPLFVYK